MPDEKRYTFDNDEIRVVLVLGRTYDGTRYLDVGEYDLADWYEGNPPWWEDGRPVCSGCSRPPQYCRCNPLTGPVPKGDR